MADVLYRRVEVAMMMELSLKTMIHGLKRLAFIFLPVLPTRTSIASSLQTSATTHYKALYYGAFETPRYTCS